MTSWTPSEPYQHDGMRPRDRGAGGRRSGPERRAGVAPASAGWANRTLPPTLTVVPWPGELTDRGGPRFPLAHRYVEVLWTPLLGPTQVILLRRLGEVAGLSGGTVEVSDLAIATGSGAGRNGTAGMHSAVARAIDRLRRFRFVTWPSGGTLAVVTSLPALPERDLQRLPDSFQLLHRHLVDELPRTA